MYLGHGDWSCVVSMLGTGVGRVDGDEPPKAE